MFFANVLDGTAKPIPTLPLSGGIGSVDADYLPLEVKGRTARIASIDWCIDLQRFVAGSSNHVATPGRNDLVATVPPSPNGLPTAITQSPTLGGAAVAEGDIRERVIGFDFQHGEIGLGITTNDLCDVFGLVLEDDFDRLPVLLTRRWSLVTQPEGSIENRSRAPNGWCGIPSGIWGAATAARRPGFAGQKAPQHFVVRKKFGESLDWRSLRWLAALLRKHLVGPWPFA